MALAVAIPIAIAAANALAQAYMANKQMGADQRRLDEIKAEFDKVVPPQMATDISTWSKEHADELPEYGNLPSFEGMTPELYKVIEKYNPQYAEYVKQANPEVVKRSQIGEEGLQAQRDVLRKLMMTGQLDQDPELMQRFAEADRNAQIGAQSRQQSIMQDFARRGQAGSGLQLASQMGAGAEAMDRSAQQSQNAATEAYKNRLNQMMQGAQLGGQMEARDLSTQEKNADIMNRFNEMTSKRYQDWLNQRADLANEGAKFNINQGQDIANKNVNLANTYKEKQGDIAKWLYEANANKQQNMFNDKIKGMQAENQAKGQQYDISMGKANAMAGLPSVNKWGYYSPIVQKAADFGTQWAAGQYAQDSANKYQDREDARAVYEKTGRWPSQGED